MSVSAEVEAILAKGTATGFEAELARFMAVQIDAEEGNAALIKELRGLMKEIEERKPEVDALDELTKRRNARKSAS